MRIVIPADTTRITEIVHSNGQVIVNVVLVDGTPKSVLQK